jgi:hypothetical protein
MLYQLVHSDSTRRCFLLPWPALFGMSKSLRRQLVSHLSYTGHRYPLIAAGPLRAPHAYARGTGNDTLLVLAVKFGLMVHLAALLLFVVFHP